MDTNGPDVGGALHYLPRDYERFIGASLSYQFQAAGGRGVALASRGVSAGRG